MNNLFINVIMLFMVHWLSIYDIHYILFCRPDYISRMDDLAFDMYQVWVFFHVVKALFCRNWLDFGANDK